MRARSRSWARIIALRHADTTLSQLVDKYGRATRSFDKYPVDTIGGGPYSLTAPSTRIDEPSVRRRRATTGVEELGMMQRRFIARVSTAALSVGMAGLALLGGSPLT